MRWKHIAFIGSLFPLLLSLVLFFGVLISADDDDGGGSYSSSYAGMNLSEDVLKHQPMVEKYAKEYGISEYVNVLLAIIQVESGGTAEDVMQSSESLGLAPNSLDTETALGYWSLCQLQIISENSVFFLFPVVSGNLEMQKLIILIFVIVILIGGIVISIKKFNH